MRDPGRPHSRRAAKNEGDQGDSAAAGFTGGYHLAFLIGAGIVAVAILVALWALPGDHTRAQEDPVELAHEAEFEAQAA